MYDIGIARKAHPLARLQARKRDFSVRMMNSSLQPVTPSHPSSSQTSSSQNGRQALGDRTKPRGRENAENRDPLASQQGLPRSGNNRGAFQIYTEGGDSGGGNEWRDLESRETHRKENHRSAVPAQGEVLKQQVPEVPRTPRVAVYVDEVCVRNTCYGCSSLLAG
jgi:checkpoint serine/threonine-protein kinase